MRAKTSQMKGHYNLSNSSGVEEEEKNFLLADNVLRD